MIATTNDATAGAVPIPDDCALPPNWLRIRLGDICQFIRGVSFDKGVERPSGLPGHVPILRAGNIRQQLELVDDLIYIPDYNVSREQRLRQGHLVFGEGTKKERMT